MLPQLSRTAVALVLFTAACSGESPTGPASAPDKMDVRQLAVVATRIDIAGKHAATYYATADAIYDRDGMRLRTRTELGDARFTQAVQDGLRLAMMTARRHDGENCLAAVGGVVRLETVKVTGMSLSTVDCQTIYSQYDYWTEFSANAYSAYVILRGGHTPMTEEELAPLMEQYQNGLVQVEYWHTIGHAQGCWD